MTVTLMFFALSLIVLIPTVIEIITHILILPEVCIGISIVIIVLAIAFKILIAKSGLHYEQAPYPGLFIVAPLAVIISIVSIVVNAIGLEKNWVNIMDIIIENIK